MLNLTAERAGGLTGRELQKYFGGTLAPVVRDVMQSEGMVPGLWSMEMMQNAFIDVLEKKALSIPETAYGNILLEAQVQNGTWKESEYHGLPIEPFVDEELKDDIIIGKDGMEYHGYGGKGQPDGGSIWNQEDIAYQIVETQAAEDVNRIFVGTMGFEPPYAFETKVNQIQLTRDITFVRVYDGINSKMQGGWLMAKGDIVGLTAKEIQNKYALPFEPKYICDVKVKKGSTIRVGVANALFGFEGGGKQYDLMGQYIGSFTNERLISEEK